MNFVKLYNFFCLEMDFIKDYLDISTSKILIGSVLGLGLIYFM